MNLENIKRLLEDHGWSLLGCTDLEIKKVEDYFGVKLPKEYITFLRTMGKNANEILKGSQTSIKDLYKLREWAEDLLQENEIEMLPENSFVFFMHQGYQFAFFLLNGSENPPVYYYYEGRSNSLHEKSDETFSDFIMNQLALSGIVL